MRDIADRKSNIEYFKNALPGLIILIGIVLRVAPYLANRSLWFDEAYLALNLVARSPSQLLQPLDFNQAAPIGFLLIEKFTEQVFGNNEYALRALPLFAGISSLFLFHFVSIQLTSKETALIGLGLFALSDRLLYFSSELKPYASDVAVALLLLWLGICVRAQNLKTRWWVALGIGGMLAPWLSYPSVFILPGIILGLGWHLYRNRNLKALRNLTLVFLLWAVSFGFTYSISLSATANNMALSNYWSTSFLSLIPSLPDLQSSANLVLDFFSDPLGSLLPILVAFIFGVGIVLVAVNSPDFFPFLAIPWLTTLLASALHLYPFSGRLLLFLVPFVLMLVAEGITAIQVKLAAISPILGITLVSLFFVQFLFFNIYPNAFAGEELKPVLAYIQSHYQKNDTLYIYNGAQPAFKYYAEKYPMNGVDIQMGIIARLDPERYQSDLERFKGRTRVWVVFSHIWHGNGDERQILLSFLDKLGVELDTFASQRASVALYDLR